MKERVISNQQKKLARLADFTPEIHEEILNSLRTALSDLKKQPVRNPGIKDIFISDCLFLYESGHSILDIFLDKGYLISDSDLQQVPNKVKPAVLIKECVEVHQFLLNSNALELIADNVHIRVGSAGFVSK